MAQVLARSELNASVWQILVRVGDIVGSDQELVVLESMKTEIPVSSPCSGRVSALVIAENGAVAEGRALVVQER